MIDLVLEEVTPDGDPHDFDERGKIEQAGLRKEQGNKLFKAGEYRRAIRRYQKGLLFADQDDCQCQESLRPMKVQTWSCGECANLVGCTAAQHRHV